MTEDIKYLSLDGVGESPFPDYPGRIVFPHVMTLLMHKQWQRFYNELPKREADLPIAGVVLTDPADIEKRMVFGYGDVELALLFGKLEMTGPDEKKLSGKSGDDLPLHVAVWLSRCYREWENSQLFFRWNGIAGVVASDGTE